MYSYEEVSEKLEDNSLCMDDFVKDMGDAWHYDKWMVHIWIADKIV